MSNQSMYAMYVIGTVESNCNWASVNYNDPITLGMMQWYGNRAADLIRLGAQSDPSGYAAFKSAAPTLAQQVEQNSVDFTARYVTQAEGNAWVAWAQRKENHQFQQAQWETDYTNYSQVCDAQGFPSGNMRERIFFMSMYHQSPQRAFNVLRSCSATASLDLLYTTCLNDGILGKYRNRYNTVYNLLKNWDGQSVPPDFGQSGDTSAGGNPTPIQPTPANKAWISQQGDCLYLHSGGATIQFKKSTAQNWFQSGDGGIPIDGGQTGTPTNPNGNANEAVKWVSQRMGKFAYGQGGGRLDPDSSGYTDCSGLWWRAYQDTLGIDVGNWTGDMAKKGKRIAFSDTDSPQQAVAKVKSGDLLLLAWKSRNPNYDHVCGFINDGQSAVYSHGGPDNGPKQMDGITDEMNVATMWEVRRYVGN